MRKNDLLNKEKTFRKAFKVEKVCSDCKAPYFTSEDREIHKKSPLFVHCKYNIAMKEL
jgi:hypothetical protein